MKKVVIAKIVFVCAFAKACTALSPSISNETGVIAQEQQFISHQVQDGETVYSISKQYGITTDQIVKLNPEAQARVYEGMVLVLPSSARRVDQDIQENIKFRTHKVKRRETLYSISRKYRVSEDLLKKYNRQLYSKPLQKGDKIRIPLNAKGMDATNTVVIGDVGSQENNVSYEPYVVQSKETVYGLARKYGITVEALVALNPEIAAGLQEGTTIKVPKKSYTDTATIDTADFEFYEVPKGATMYSLLRRLEMNADELVQLNPALAEGLKEGMILKIPNNLGLGNVSETLFINRSTKGSLWDSISYPQEKRLALLLPFGTERMKRDTLTLEENLKKDAILRLSLDYYSGVLMAVEEAGRNGIGISLEVLDTDYNRRDGTAVNARKVENLVSNLDTRNTDVVIGPLLSTNFDRAAAILLRKNIPVVNLLSTSIQGGPNVFQSRPSDERLREMMLRYLQDKGVGKNIIVISDAKNEAIKTKLLGAFPSAKIVAPRVSDNGYYFYAQDIQDVLSEAQENWVILETDDIPLISNVTTTLNASLSDQTIRLFTTKKGTAFESDEIQNKHLENLAFHYPSIDSEVTDDENRFNLAFKEKFGLSPNRHAIRGYDVTMDVILRLAYMDNLQMAAMTGVATEYQENKFHYIRNTIGGFINDAVYLMRYASDLQLEEVPMSDPYYEGK